MSTYLPRRDLPARLHLFIEEKRHQPFAWGVNDCCLFACDWLAMWHGIDPAADLGLRGTYTTPLTAWRIVQRLGGVEAIAVAACEKNNWPDIPKQFARRGDLVTTATRHGPAMGVYHGSGAVFPGADGAVFMPLAACGRAWRTS